MKKIKLLGLLSITALLSACNFGGSIEVKAPKFASEGSEYSFADLKTAVGSSTFLGAFSGDYDGVPSAASSERETFLDSRIVKQDGKVKKEYDSKQVGITKRTYNVDDMRIEYYYETKSARKEKDPYSTSERNALSKEHVGYRYWNIEDKAWLVSFDYEDKSYAKNMDASSLDDAHKKLDIQARCRDTIRVAPNMIFTIANGYEYYSAEEQAKFKCYKSEGIYTITYVSDETIEAKDSSDQLLYKGTVKVEKKYQIDTTKGSEFTYKLSEVTTTSVSFSKDATYSYTSYKGGQTLERVETHYDEFEVSLSGTNIKEVDLSGYKLIEA